MIIKTTRGSSGTRLLNYQRRLDKPAADQAGVRFFAKNLIHSIDNAGEVLDRLAEGSGRKNQIVHLILRAESGLSLEDWHTAMMAVLNEAGLANRTWIAFLHDHDDDTAGNHMHIAAVAVDREGNPPPGFLRSMSLDRRVTADEATTLPRGDVKGRRWDSQLDRRLMSVARKLEDDLGLRPLARDRSAQASEREGQMRISQAQRDRQRRTGIAPLADLIDVAATRAALDRPDYETRAAELAALDLILKPYISKDGRLRGARLHRLSDPRLHCPASALGGSYSMEALDKRSEVSFIDWYNAGGSGPSQSCNALVRVAQPVDRLVEAYERYKQDLLEQQRRIFEQRAALAEWRKEQRRKAFALKQARWPKIRSRRTGVHRAEIAASYRLQCDEIEREVMAQRESLGALRSRRLSYVEWLAVEAHTDRSAADKYATLQDRSTHRSPVAPRADAEPAAPLPARPPERKSLSAAEIAAIVEEQERLIRFRDHALANAGVLKEAPRLAALTNRLEASGVALVFKADQQDKRVTVERNTVLIDGRRSLTVSEDDLAHPVIRRAQMIAADQTDQVENLAMVIRLAEGLPPYRKVAPRTWLEGFCPRSAVRWLTSVQEAEIGQRWSVDAADAASVGAMPSMPAFYPAGAAITPRTKTERPPAQETGSVEVVEPDAAPVVKATTPVVPVPPVEPAGSAASERKGRESGDRHRNVVEAIAMVKAPMQRAAAEPPHAARTSAQVIETRLGDLPSPVPAKPVAAERHDQITSARRSAGEDPPSIRPLDAPQVDTTTSDVGPKRLHKADPPRPESSDVRLIAEWFKVSKAARADPKLALQSEAIAARLMADPTAKAFFEEIGFESAREAQRQATEYHLRQRSARLPDLPPAPAVEASVHDHGPVIDPPQSTDDRPTKAFLQRAADLKRMHEASDRLRRG